MRLNIITNLSNGVGLQQEYELLRAELEALGHRVRGIQFNAPQHIEQADVNVFLEVLVPELFSIANQQWAIPDPEWWKPEYTPHLSRISKVLCKTHDAMRLFKPISDHVQWLGFMSRDLYRPEIPKEMKFLHVAGNSAIKNTEAIVMAWKMMPYPLTIVTKLISLQRFASQVPHIDIYGRLADAEFIEMMNTHQFHLCPSQYEGYGHAFHEALGVGAIVLTCDASPMNEFGAPIELLMPTTVGMPLRLATLHKVNAAGVRSSVELALALSSTWIEEQSRQARQTFADQTAEFRERLLYLVGRA